jgi:phytoene synthase
MDSSDPVDLAATLGPVEQLALAYAGAAARGAWRTFLVLDARLAGVVRNVREPVLAQIRLAWWRDRLAADPATWPAGEPLLAELALWPAGTRRLTGLVDGWETMLGEPPLDAAQLTQFAEGRAAAIAALGEALGIGADGDAQRMAAGWALGDLAAHLTRPDEREVVAALVQAHDWRSHRLPRGLRPLVVLHGLAARTARSGGRDDRGIAGVGALITAMRLGIFGS